MQSLNCVLNVFRDAGLNSSVSLLFKNNEFHNEVYFFYSGSDFNTKYCRGMFQSLALNGGHNIQRSNDSLYVKSISSWTVSSIKLQYNSMHMLEGNITESVDAIPEDVFKLFYNLPNENFDTYNSYNVVKIEVEREDDTSLFELFTRQEYFKSHGLNIISIVREKLRVINIEHGTNYLIHAQQQKQLAETLITDKLRTLSGRLKGIRHEYKSNKVDIDAICLIYEISDINVLEDSLKLRWKERSESLITNKLERAPVKTNTSRVKVKKSIVALKNNDTLIETNHEVSNNILISNKIDDTCYISKFHNRQDIDIEVRSLKILDAFDFESLNNKLVVIINGNHIFYTEIYLKSSEEGRRLLDMMISSLCHLSHINVSEKVQRSDRKLFSRWSEYIEEYILGDS